VDLPASGLFHGIYDMGYGTNMNMVERTEYRVPTVKRVVYVVLPELLLRSASLRALALCSGASRLRDRGFQTHGTFSCSCEDRKPEVKQVQSGALDGGGPVWL
jgi:hypothetical protein